MVLPEAVQKLINSGKIRPAFFSEKPRNLYETLLTRKNFGVGLTIFPEFHEGLNPNHRENHLTVKKVKPQWHMHRAVIVSYIFKRGRLRKNYWVPKLDCLASPWKIIKSYK